MTTRRWLPISTVLLLALAAVPAAADKPHDHKHDHKGDHRGDSKPDDTKKKVLEILMKEVGLSEKKAKETEIILSKFAPERKKQFKAIREQRKVLHELLDKKSDDEAAYGKALATLRDAQRKHRAARDQQFEDIAKVLSAKEQAKVLKAMPELQRKMRDPKDSDDDDDKESEL